jgi:transcriptional regulator with XRE-family HTH domain
MRWCLTITPDVEIENRRGDVMQITILNIVRFTKNKTQAQMAKALNIGTSAYNMYESASRKIPLKKAQQIAEILEINIDEIFTPASYTARIKNPEDLSKGENFNVSGQGETHSTDEKRV